MGLLLVAFAAWSSPAQSDAEKEVRKLERAWLDAYEQRDAKAMDEIVGEEFVITFPAGGKQTKPELMTMIKGPARLPPNAALRYHTEDVKAEIKGDKVILSGRVVTERLIDGRPTSREESLYVDTYVKRNGRWQVIESHLADPPKKAN